MPKPITAADDTALSIFDAIHQELTTVEHLLRTGMSYGQHAPNGKYLVPAATLVNVHDALERLNAIKAGFLAAVEAEKAEAGR